MARSLKNPSWRPFPAAYEPGTYTRVGVQSLSDKELAKEYSRVRREAQERLRSFQRSRDPELRSASVVAEKAGLYLNRAQIKQVTSSAAEARGMMEDLLIDAYRFVSAKTSSLSGYKQTRSKQINSLQAAGYDFIDESNIRWFGQFMDYFRDRKYSKSHLQDVHRQQQRHPRFLPHMDEETPAPILLRERMDHHRVLPELRVSQDDGLDAFRHRLFRYSAMARRALPRWEMAFFCSSVISAAVTS